VFNAAPSNVIVGLPVEYGVMILKRYDHNYDILRKINGYDTERQTTGKWQGSQ